MRGTEAPAQVPHRVRAGEPVTASEARTPQRPCPQKAVQVNATLSPAFSLNWQPPTGVEAPLTEMFQ